MYPKTKTDNGQERIFVRTNYGHAAFVPSSRKDIPKNYGQKSKFEVCPMNLSNFGDNPIGSRRLKLLIKANLLILEALMACI